MKKKNTTPLERRVRRALSWPVPRQNPTCALCGDAGWLVAVMRRPPGGDYTFRCTCAAGDALVVDAPRWNPADQRFARRTPSGRVVATDATPPVRGGADRAAGPDD